MSAMDMDLDTLGDASAGVAGAYSAAEDMDGGDWALVGIGALATAGVGAAAYLAATSGGGAQGAGDGYQGSASSQAHAQDGASQAHDSGSGGLGMTYGGKLGIELAPGLVYSFDGELGLGFGF